MAVEKPMGIKIDFSRAEVTNLASLQEVVGIGDTTQAINEEIVQVIKGTSVISIVRNYP